MKNLSIFKYKSVLFCTLFLFVQNSFAGKLSNLFKSTDKSETSRETASNVSGSPLGTHSVGFGLGQTFLTGDFGENGEDSITVDVYYKYKASYSFDLMVNTHYSKHEYENKISKLFGMNAGIKGRLYNFDSFNPYVIAGLGFYMPQVKRTIDGVLKESESKLSFGTHIGIGGELELNEKFSVGVLAHYHNPFDVKQGKDPEIEGSYYKLLFTTLYSFN